MILSHFYFKWHVFVFDSTGTYYIHNYTKFSVPVLNFVAPIILTYTLQVFLKSLLKFHENVLISVNKQKPICLTMIKLIIYATYWGHTKAMCKYLRTIFNCDVETYYRSTRSIFYVPIVIAYTMTFQLVQQLCLDWLFIGSGWSRE